MDTQWNERRNFRICCQWLDYVPTKRLATRHRISVSSVRRILRAGITSRLLVKKRVQRWRRGVV